MNAAEDFMLLLLYAHIVAVVEAIQSVHPTDSVADERFVCPQKGSDGDKCEDKVHVYSMEVLSLGLLWHGFHDAIKEGDGERILRDVSPGRQ